MTFPFPHPLIAATASGEATTLAYTQFKDELAENAAVTLLLPSNIVAGDLLFLFLYGLELGGPTAPALVSPPGYTLIKDTVGGTLRTAWFGKIATASDAGASVTGMAGSEESVSIIGMHHFHPDRPLTPFTVSNIEHQRTAGNPSAQVKDVPSSVPSIVCAFYFAENSINPRTFSPAKDGENGFGQPSPIDSNIWLAWKFYGAPPAMPPLVAHTIDMDDEGGSNELLSWILEF